MQQNALRLFEENLAVISESQEHQIGAFRDNDDKLAHIKNIQTKTDHCFDLIKDNILDLVFTKDSAYEENLEIVRDYILAKEYEHYIKKLHPEIWEEPVKFDIDQHEKMLQMGYDSVNLNDLKSDPY